MNKQGWLGWAGLGWLGWLDTLAPAEERSWLSGGGCGTIVK